MTYILLKANESKKTNKKKIRKNKIKSYEDEISDIEIDDSQSENSNTSSKSSKSSKSSRSSKISVIEIDQDSNEDNDIELSEDSDKESTKLSENSEETSDEEYLFEYDETDEKYEELIDKQLSLNSEESNMEYYHYLPKKKKDLIYQKTKEIYDFSGNNIPLRFKIIDSEMDIKTKSIALENLDKMAEMDVSTGEHSKMDHWINGLMKIPFGKYNSIPINENSPIDEKKDYIKNTYQILNKAIYGHLEAKTHILQVIGKWIKNPNSGGNVLAIQGPMGNGKTTLVKEGISKVLNRPFFVALGGASDSAYFDGHCYTYEGYHWGRIVQILQDSKCMNPIIYFDELDKISDTAKGDEIVHLFNTFNRSITKFIISR